MIEIALVALVGDMCRNDQVEHDPVNSRASSGLPLGARSHSSVMVSVLNQRYISKCGAEGLLLCPLICLM